MRAKPAGFLIAATLLATVAFGQSTVNRVYSFKHIDSWQEVQQIAIMMRTTAGLKQADANNTLLSVTAAGTAEQIGVTDWLFKELDQAPPAQPSVSHQYSVGKDDIVRMFYLPTTESVQEFQELANAVRTIGEIRIAFAENGQHALVIRGPAAQVDQAAWLVDDLAQTTHGSETHEKRLADDDVTRVFYLTHTASIQDFQEIANASRTIAQIRRVVALNGPRAIVVRGTTSDIAMSAWLLSQFDRAQAPSAPASYSNGSDDVVRVFYFPANRTIQDFQSSAITIRNAVQLRMAVAVNPQRAFAVRGTTAQIARTEQMVQDLNSPAR